MGDLLCVDFKNRSKEYTRHPADAVSEGPTDYRALEAEIAAALWFAPSFDTPVEYLLPDYMPPGPGHRMYRVPENDPA